MELLFLLLYIASAVCFALAAFGRGKYDTRFSLVPLGLLFWVAIPLIQHFLVLD